MSVQSRSTCPIESTVTGSGYVLAASRPMPADLLAVQGGNHAARGPLPHRA